MNNIMVLFSLLEQKGLTPALIPSTVFVLVTLFVFDPIIKLSSSVQQQSLATPSIVLGLLSVTLIIVFSYTILALNTFILKIFEGYYIFPPFFHFGRRTQLIRARRLMEHRDRLENLIRHLEEDTGNIPGSTLSLEELRDQHYLATTSYSMRYPEDLSSILPTRFGNILKAAENYSGERYGFDGVALWPRLVQVIPSEYKSSIDNTRNELSFFINMSFLSIVFSLLCVPILIYYLWIDDIANITRYLLGTTAGYISFSFFYNVSINSVISFGSMIRSSFDLFRLDLLKKLGLPRPKDSIEEFYLWRNVNELITLGSHSLTFTKLDYQIEDKLKGTNREVIHFNNISYPKPDVENSSNEKAVQLDLGGITINIGDFMKELSALLKDNPSKRQTQKKSKTPKKASSKVRKKPETERKPRIKSPAS